MVQVRPYRASDARAVSEIIRTTMRVSNATDYPPERLQLLIEYFSPEKVQQINRERRCLVAETDGQLIGTAALEGDELVTFFILPEHQGKGVGTALLERLEAAAQDREVLRVDASVTGAGFYERHGYVPTGAILDGTAGPQVCMRKRLAPGPARR